MYVFAISILLYLSIFTQNIALSLLLYFLSKILNQAMLVLKSCSFIMFSFFKFFGFATYPVSCAQGLVLTLTQKSPLAVSGYHDGDQTRIDSMQGNGPTCYAMDPTQLFQCFKPI